MSFRLRMFLLFGGLAAVLLASDWILVHALTKDLSSEFKIAKSGLERA